MSDGSEINPPPSEGPPAPVDPPWLDEEIEAVAVYVSEKSN